MMINVAPLLRQPVGTQVEYHIAEDPIDPRGENAGLLEADAVSIEAEVKASHTDPGALLEGTERADVQVSCSRCLRSTRVSVRARFAEQYYATIAVMSGGPLDEAPLDAKTIGSDFRIDVTPLLREELLLAMPQAPLCRPDCAGLCPVCGEDLNERPHQHEEPVDERWAQLGQLKDFHPDR
jgi:uncharacterized protein